MCDAQKPDQTPAEGKKGSVYRVSSSVVTVDAIVTDKHNRPVLNLSADDIAVFEDGVPQEIDSFVVHRGTPETPPHTSAPSSDKSAAPPTEPAQFSNLTIILPDYSTTVFQNEKLVREGSVKYVEQKFPSDSIYSARKNSRPWFTRSPPKLPSRFPSICVRAGFESRETNTVSR